MGGLCGVCSHIFAFVLDSGNIGFEGQFVVPGAWEECWSFASFFKYIELLVIP